MQQCVYQIALKNVYKFKKQLAKSGLIWSRTSSTLLSLHEEIISVPVFAQCANIWSTFTAGSWKKTIRWNISQCVKNVNKMCFCAFFRRNDTTLDKNVGLIFRWFWIFQVVQKQTIDEVKN